MESVVTLKLHSNRRLAPYELESELRKILSQKGYAISGDFFATEVRGLKLTNGNFNEYATENAYRSHITTLQSAHKTQKER